MFYKKIIPYILFLLLLISMLLTWQWNLFQMRAESDLDNRENPVQSIEVHRKNEKMIINQLIENLDNKTYQLHYPVKGSNFQWKTGKSIETGEKSEITVQDETVQFTYEIPADSKYHSLFLDDWYIQMEGAEISRTKIRISETVYKDSTWAAGGTLAAKERMDYLDYYEFERQGGAFPLYWESSELPLLSFNHFSIYGKPHDPLEDYRFFRYTDDQGLKDVPNIVFTGVNKPIVTPDLFIVPKNIEGSALDLLWFQQYLSRIWDLPKEQEWLQSFFAHLLTGLQPEGERENEMYDALRMQMDDSEWHQFLKQLVKAKIRNAGDIDQILSNIKGLMTDYFTLNQHDEKPLVPLRFYLKKPVVVFEKKLDNLKVYLEKSGRFYPFEEIMKTIGFDYEQISNNEVYLENEKDTIRFYYDKDIFIYNEERYGLFSKDGEAPFLIMDQKFYVNENLLIQLFHLQIYEYENYIHIF